MLLYYLLVCSDPILSTTKLQKCLPVETLISNTDIIKTNPNQIYIQNNLVESNSDKLNSYWISGRLISKWRLNVIWSTSKSRNKQVRMRNGNGHTRSQLTIIHWNAGSKLWANKTTLKLKVC